MEQLAMPRLLKRAWEGWKEIGASIGDFQSRLLLTVFYFTVAVPFGILTRLVIDPLRLRHRPTTSGWTARQPIDSDLASARRQF
jgi:hypothetical protein